MNIGKLNRRVGLQIKSGFKDGYGQPVETWNTYKEVWCSKKDLVMASAALNKEGEQEISKRVSKFLIRYRSDLNGSWRLMFEGSVYEIIQIGEVGNRSGLEILAFATESDFYQDA